MSPEWLLVRMFRTKYSFINHSRQPNCRVWMQDGRLVVETLCAIAPGQELTLDYCEEPLPPAYLAGHGATCL